MGAHPGLPSSPVCVGGLQAVGEQTKTNPSNMLLVNGRHRGFAIGCLRDMCLLEEV